MNISPRKVLFSLQAKCRAFSKKKVAILGSGWGGFRLAQDLDKEKFDVHVISPRNHFLFTPLLPSTAVGTLEFRCVQEPVRTIPGVHYVQAHCEEINFTDKTLTCLEVFKKRRYKEKYDCLVLAVGSETNTFGVPGVYESPNVFFLKQLEHARAIRQKLIECFERASTPDLSESERKRLLTFVVVGGGPTNVEFASELHDFLNDDVSKWYPDLRHHVRVVMVEASGHILGTFNSALVDYVEKLFHSRNIDVMTNMTVKEVRGNVAVLGNDMLLPFGVMVWSTGVKQVPLIQNLSADIAKARGGRLMVDSHLRVLRSLPPAEESPPSGKSTVHGTSAEGGVRSLPTLPVGDGSVFALGDCACDSVKPLPPLAQVERHVVCVIVALVSDGGVVDCC